MTVMATVAVMVTVTSVDVELLHRVVLATVKVTVTVTVMVTPVDVDCSIASNLRRWR